MTHTIFIIGFGRFGRTITKILRKDFQVMVYDEINYKSEAESIGVQWVDLKSGIQKSNILIYAIPISAFKDTFLSHLPFLKKKEQGIKTLIIDIQSIKVFPKKVYDQYLPKNYDVLLTHPMFGPDSIREKGYPGLKIMMDPYQCPEEIYNFWKKYFSDKKFQLLELTSEQHDQFAAYSQGLVFFLTRILENFQFKSTPIDTLWVEKLHDILKILTHDSWQLFSDIQNYNPYTKEMRIKLEESFYNIFNKLLPEVSQKKKIKIGIQGGKGSFNEEAVHEYIRDNHIDQYTLVYLHTTENVFKSLHRGEIDLGQFAIHNSTGGMVQESIYAMSRYKFRIVSEYSIEICHMLMAHIDTDLNNVTSIMTHPQVIKQCRENLRERYPHLALTSGEGELIDHARVAELLSKGQIDATKATIGSRVLAEIYNLKIIAKNLQDLKHNLTGFLMVSR